MYVKQIMLVVSFVFASFSLTGIASGQQGATDGEWRSYGADTGSTKYSPLDQITKENFEKLEIDWRWQSVDALVAKAEGGGTWFGPSREVFDVLAEEDAERWNSDLYGERPGTYGRRPGPAAGGHPR